MKATFAHKCALRLLRLYPYAWRERYTDEAAAVLEERPATLLTLLDLVLGILDAYLHTDLFTERKFVMLQRLRNSQITIFCAFVFFAPFWVIYNVAEPLQSSFFVTSATPAHHLLSEIVRAAGFFAVLTSLIGGCAFAVVAARQAFVGKKEAEYSTFCLESL